MRTDLCMEKLPNGRWGVYPLPGYQTGRDLNGNKFIKYHFVGTKEACEEYIKNVIKENNNGKD